MSYKVDRHWSDKRMAQVTKILKDNAMHIVKIEIAPETRDTKEATDLIIEVTGGSVAVRVRRSNTRYRDLTIRSRRPSGIPTELHKLREGFCDWYLYGWTDNGHISEWILVDLNQMRNTELFDKARREISNPDRSSWFVAISLGELFANGCLTSFDLQPATITKHKIRPLLPGLALETQATLDIE